MTFEETLISTLASGSIVCYPLEKPQGVTTPVAVYKRLTTNRERIHGSKSTFNRIRMSITLYGTTYSAVKTAVGTVNTLLDENTTNFSLAYLYDQKDFPKDDSGLFSTYLEYVIFGHLN